MDNIEILKILIESNRNLMEVDREHQEKIKALLRISKDFVDIIRELNVRLAKLEILNGVTE